MNEPRRQIGYAIAAAICGLVFLALTVWLAVAGGWWIVLSFCTGLLTIVFAYGVWESLGNVPRDKQGKRLE